MLIVTSRINLILNVFRKVLAHTVMGGWMIHAGSDMAGQCHGKGIVQGPGWAITSWWDLALGSPWPGRAGLGEAGDLSSCCITGAGWGEPWGWRGVLPQWQHGVEPWAVRAQLPRLERDLRKYMPLYSPLTENTCLMLLTRSFCLWVFKDWNGKVGLVLIMSLCNGNPIESQKSWDLWEGTSGWPWVQSVCLDRKTQSQLSRTLSRHPWQKILERKWDGFLSCLRYLEPTEGTNWDVFK